MDKYTLLFQDRQTEKNYQQQRQHEIRKPIFLCSVIGLFFISMIKLITDILQDNLSELGILLGTQAYLILSFIIVRWKPEFVQIGLITLNFVLLAYQQILSLSVSQESQQLFANNFTTCNLIIILMVDMIQAYLLVISTFLIKLIITIMNDQSPSYNVYFATIFLIGYLSYCIRKLHCESRGFFLLSLKDNLWEQILPIIVNKSFILFQFDQVQLKFSLISQQKLDFECLTSDDLKIFLREWHYNQQTLEELLFHEIRQKRLEDIKQSSQKILVIKDKKQRMWITYCLFNYQRPTFLIKIENDCKLKERLKTLVCKSFEKNTKIQSHLFKCIVKNLTLSLQLADMSQLFILRVYCYKQLLNYKIANNQFNQKILDVKTICNTLEKMFSFQNISFQIIQKQQNEKIISLKIFFARLLLEICNQSNKNSTVLINIERLAPYIRYIGKPIQSDKDAIISTVLVALVKKQIITKINNFTHNIVILHEEPNHSFA